VKAEQEAKLRSDFTRKSSSGSDGSVKRDDFHYQQQQQPSKLKSSASVRVTVRSTASKPPVEENRTQDDMSLSSHKNTARVSEDFFTPPNKQSYVEYKSTAKTMNTTSTTTNSVPTIEPVSRSKQAAIDFDLMSELDDLINYDPNAQPTKKKKAATESKATTEVASDLLHQLQSLEDEMKIGFSSVEEQQQSRRSSNSSVNSKSSGMYATVNKKPHSSSSVSSVPGKFL